MKLIYMDNAATTKIRPEVLESMMPYLTEQFGNPSSISTPGQLAKEAIEAARQKVAKSIGSQINEIIFTSGGSEADNLALIGTSLANRDLGQQIITSQIEHHAVLETCQYLADLGFKITYLPTDSDGLVRLDDLKAALSEKTVLVSIMMANNEIGTIQPIKELAQLAHQAGALFHTDAVQAAGNLAINVQYLGIDLLSISGHKVHAPKGVGALFVRKGVKIKSLIHGGPQENHLRAGTENVASIVGFGKAMELANRQLVRKVAQITKMRDFLISQILNQIPDARLNGSLTNRLPGNVNISFRYIEGEAITLRLDLEGICTSSGSACTSGSLQPSHVLLAIGLDAETAHGSLRLTINEDTTQAELDYLIDKLKIVVQSLRDMSPLNKERNQ